MVTNSDPLMLNEDVDCVAGIDWLLYPFHTMRLRWSATYSLKARIQHSMSHVLAKLSSSTPIPYPPELSGMDQCFSMRCDGRYKSGWLVVLCSSLLERLSSCISR
ncbi:MAG: hypothetical protein ABI341_02590 [Nitrososphaera sp.]